MSDVRISVVVLTCNRVAEVLRTLDRLSSLPERPALIVVDNASVDGTASAIAGAFPEACTIRLNRNIGAAARNAGILFARTPYVALCDDDTWWEPGSLAHAGDVLDGHPRLAVITAKVLVGPDQQEDPTCRRMAQSPLSREAGLPGCPILGFLAGASIVRRAAFLEVGGFEPRLFIGGEEALVAMDLAAAGWRMAYIDGIVAHHYPSDARDAEQRRRLLLRNAVWVAWLRRPIPAAARRTIRLITETVPKPQRASFLTETIAGLPWILRRRHVNPPEVEAQVERLEAA